MEQTLTTEAAVRQALNDSSKLVTADKHAALPQEEADNCETVYSLASLYSQFAQDPAAAETQILAALEEKHGKEYF